MPFPRLLPYIVVALLAGCSSLSSSHHRQRMTPREAIFAAADATPRGVRGVFDIRVKATGCQDGYTYLNTEIDYRDQRNLSIELTPKAAVALTKQLGERPEVALKGKHLRITGTARRVTIWITVNGYRLNKYYYQTHVAVDDPNQIEILN